MLFYILTFLCGFLLFLGPIIVGRLFSKKWNLPRSLFWRAGLWHLFLSLFYFMVIGNLSSVWPQFESTPFIIQAFFLGLLSALFLELGRFVVLDKAMQQIRSLREALFFSLGWTGVSVFLIGLVTMINSFGIYFLVHTQDFKSQFPQITAEQITLLEETKKEAVKLSQVNPLMALTPLVEGSASFAVDIAMTLLVLFTFRRGQTRFVWGAVFFRTLFIALPLYLAQMHLLWAEMLFILFGILAILFIQRMRILIPEN